MIVGLFSYPWRAAYLLAYACFTFWLRLPVVALWRDCTRPEASL